MDTSIGIIKTKSTMIQIKPCLHIKDQNHNEPKQKKLEL